eukprot:10863697-Alexandrium_andersonii.AAC.1
MCIRDRPQEARALQGLPQPEGGPERQLRAPPEIQPLGKEPPEWPASAGALWGPAVRRARSCGRRR